MSLAAVANYGSVDDSRILQDKRIGAYYALAKNPDKYVQYQQAQQQTEDEDLEEDEDEEDKNNQTFHI